MTAETARDYRRALALHCLAKLTVPVTAGDLLEHMGVAAQTELHPQALFRGIDARAVAGILRSLERDDMVRKCGAPRHNGHHGREEPCWEIVRNGTRHPMPSPPEDADADAGTTTPPEQMTATQLLARVRALQEQVAELKDVIRDQEALLDAKDDFLQVQERYAADLDATRARVRARLIRKGLLVE